MTSRNQSLDVLRGLAVLLVLGYHFPYFPIVSKIGWCGVDLFFVLSGYLISGLLFREYLETGSANVPRFWLRRGLKIWPALYAFLFVLFPLFNGQGKSFSASAFFYANYFPDEIKVLRHTWSLAVEEHFYLALPLLLLLLFRFGKLNLVPWIGAALLAICLTLRIIFPANAWAGTQFRIDSLFVGVVLGYWRYFEYERFIRIGRTRNLFLACGLLCALLLPVRQMGYFGFPCLALGFAIILAWAVERKPQSRTGKNACWALAVVGFYSYSIYLWQQPFMAVYGYRPTLSGFVVAFSGAIAVGIGMAKLVELPILALRERWLPKIKIPERVQVSGTAEPCSQFGSTPHAALVENHL